VQQRTLSGCSRSQPVMLARCCQPFHTKRDSSYACSCLTCNKLHCSSGQCVGLIMQLQHDVLTMARAVRSDTRYAALMSIESLTARGVRASHTAAVTVSGLESPHFLFLLLCVCTPALNSPVAPQIAVPSSCMRARGLSGP
jgi:hypothetical protein